MIKSPDVIQKIKKTESNGVTVLKNVLSNDEISSLHTLYNKLSTIDEYKKLRTVRDSRVNEITTIRPEYREEVNKILISKLNILPFEYESMQFYKIQNPYHIHSDTGKNNRVSYLQGVIPLGIEPKKTAKTVIFNQRVYFSSEYVFPGIGKDPGYEPFNNIATRDPSIYEGWTNTHNITEDQAKSIWYDKWEYWMEHYKGFSIKYIYEWNVGDILLFERSLLHASSLIQEAEIDYKLGLLFLTYLPI
jgi:hypothetical protein